MHPKYLCVWAIILWLSYLLVSSSVNGQGRNDEVEADEMQEKMIQKMNDIKEPLGDIAYQVQTLSMASMDAFNVLQSMEKILVNLGPALMVASMAISLITAFLPQPDSKELAYMKEKFDIAISGMTRIENKLAHVENVIVHESTKLSLGEYQRTIFALYEDWQAVVTAKKKQEKFLREVFVDQYENSYKKAALNLWRAMTGNFDGELNNNLLATAKERYKCDGMKILKLCAMMAHTINQGIALEGAYYTYTESFDRIESEEIEWKNRMQIFSHRCEAVMKECRAKWRDYAMPVLEDVYNQFKNADNEVLARKTFNTLSSKFGQRAWFVFVYNSVTGFENHGYVATEHIVGESVIKKWRENKKMFTVATFDKAEYPSFTSEEKARTAIATFRDNVLSCSANYPGAKQQAAANTILDELVEDAKTSGLLTYAIKSDLNLKFFGTDGRFIRIQVPTSNACPKYSHFNFDIFSMG